MKIDQKYSGPIVVLWVLFTVATIVLIERVSALDRYDSDGWTSESLERIGVADSVSRGDRGARAFLPNPNLTPGAVWKQVTIEQIQKPGYSKTVRNVTEKMKLEVMDAYGWPHDKPCEIDHLVPLCIGGSQNHAKPTENLWPQPAVGEWNFKVKDRLEREALKEVREGKLELRATQRAFATDWIALYRKVFGDKPQEATIRDEEQ